MTMIPLILTVSPEDILVEMLSWLAFLQRWSVLSQLIVLAVIVLVARMRSLQLRLNQYRFHQQLPEAIRVLLGPALILILAAVIAALQAPFGLLRYFGLL